MADQTEDKGGMGFGSVVGGVAGGAGAAAGMYKLREKTRLVDGALDALTNDPTSKVFTAENAGRHAFKGHVDTIVSKTPEGKTESLKDAYGAAKRVLGSKDADKAAKTAATTAIKDARAAVFKEMPKEVSYLKNLTKGQYGKIGLVSVAGVAVGAFVVNKLFGGKHTDRAIVPAQEPQVATGRA
jgi:hypothetical protein